MPETHTRRIIGRLNCLLCAISCKVRMGIFLYRRGEQSHLAFLFFFRDSRMSGIPKPDTKDGTCHVTHLPGNEKRGRFDAFLHLKWGNHSSLQVQALLTDKRVRGGVSTPQLSCKRFGIRIKTILIKDFETVYLVIECGPAFRHILFLNSIQIQFKLYLYRTFHARKMQPEVLHRLKQK